MNIRDADHHAMEKALKMLDTISNPEVLREYSKMVLAHAARLEKRIAEYETEAQKKAEDLRFSFADKLSSLNKIVFDHGQERRKTKDRPFEPDYQSSAGAVREVLLHSEAILPPPKNDLKKAKLPRSEKIHELSESDKAQVLAEYGIADGRVEAMAGFYEESTEVTVVERTYIETRHKRQKYRVISNSEARPDEENKTIIVTARGPVKLLEGASYAVDFAVEVVSDKYLYHMPLERQIRQMERQGLITKPKTLYNLCAVSAAYLESIREKIKTEIRSENLCIHCDETPWPINNAKDSDGYMWILSNQMGAYYAFEPTRSGEVIGEILKGYSGSCLSDGYQGYNRLKSMKNVRLGNCWAHARRKFIECEENYPSESKEVLDLMDELFRIEHRATDYAHLKILRETDSKIFIEKIHEWLLRARPEARPESSLRKAIDYTLKYWSGLTEFLVDLTLPLTNNDAERAIRHAVMGRKNFQGSRSIDGADVTATLYTVIETCKRLALDPKSYLRYAITEAASGGDPLTPYELAKKERAS